MVTSMVSCLGKNRANGDNLDLSDFDGTRRGSLGNSTKSKSKAKQIEKRIKQEEKNYASTYRLLLLDEGELRSRSIERKLRKEREEYSGTHRLLLLEKRQKVQDIRRNVRDAILSITGAMSGLNPPIELGDPGNSDSLEFMHSSASRPDFDYPPEFFRHTQALWSDSGVQAAYERANEYQLID
uniref:Guanine nucleotide-binding protein G(s) subunit alpha n=1 Tax=Macrostomum lignano TaxID=282301 RepID=A0A1I8J7N8_9PLAT